MRLRLRDPALLRRLMAATGTSTRQLETTTGISKSMVSAMANGQRGVEVGCPPHRAEALAKALGIEVGVLFTSDSAPTPLTG